MNPGTCRSHCCAVHGCKYGHEDCPVANGVMGQDHLCERCYDVLDEYDSIVKEYMQIKYVQAKVDKMKMMRNG